LNLLIDYTHHTPPPPIYFPQHTKENNNYHGNKRTASVLQALLLFSIFI